MLITGDARFIIEYCGEEITRKKKIQSFCDPLGTRESRELAQRSVEHLTIRVLFRVFDPKMA